LYFAVLLFTAPASLHSQYQVSGVLVDPPNPWMRYALEVFPSQTSVAQGAIASSLTR